MKGAAPLGKAMLIGFLVVFGISRPESISAGEGEWTSNGPHAIWVEALAIDPATPATLYAGGGSEVYKSTDGGESWNSASSGLPGKWVFALAIDPATPTTLYAGTWFDVVSGGGGGVHKSTDGGANWSPVNDGLVFLATFVRALAIDPVTPATLYAGTGGGVYKSTNGGGNWSQVSSGEIYALAIDPVTPATLYSGSWSGVYKSTNGGGDWNPVNTGLTDDDIEALTIDPLTPNTLYAGTFSGGVFKSTNGGGSWSPASSGLTSLRVQALAIDPATPSTLYAGTYNGGVFKSTDGGASWSEFNAGLTDLDVRALAIDPLTPTTLHAGTYGGEVFSYSAKPPALTLNFGSGAPGSFFSVTGVDFPASTTAEVTVNGHALGTVPTDVDGNCSFILSTANAEEGSYFVTVSANPKATARFALDSNEPIRPQDGVGPIFDVPANVAFTESVFLPVIQR